MTFANDLGLYIHVPFCAKLCPYCDFAVAIRREPDFGGYVDAVLRELDARSAEYKGAKLRTVYVGGGTPSLLPARAFGRLVEGLQRHVDLGTVEEFTIEANPASVDTTRIQAWLEAGVGRVSLGVQSFNEHALSMLGRNHDGALARTALEALLDAGFETSLDLIFSGPEYSQEILLGDLEILSKYPTLGHVSAYQLTIEPNTVFGQRMRRGGLSVPDEDDASDAYDLLRDQLVLQGFEQYEVSSHARPGRRALHNSGYWEGRPYLGLGVGAYSFRSGGDHYARRSNTRNLKSYLNAPEQPHDVEEISARDHLRELLFLGVRHLGGVEPSRLKTTFDAVQSAEWDALEQLLRRLADAGLLATDGERFYPTSTGFALADSVAEALWGFDDLRGRPTSS